MNAEAPLAVSRRLRAITTYVAALTAFGNGLLLSYAAGQYAVAIGGTISLFGSLYLTSFGVYLWITIRRRPQSPATQP